MRQIGTATGIGDMHISITVAFLSLITVFGLDWILDFTLGITFRITPTTTTHTITMRTVSRTIIPPLITVSPRLMTRSKPSSRCSLTGVLHRSSGWHFWTSDARRGGELPDGQTAGCKRESITADAAVSWVVTANGRLNTNIGSG